MGCDIAAIFLAGGWRVTAVETDRGRWPEAQARVRSDHGKRRPSFGFRCATRIVIVAAGVPSACTSS